MKKLVPVPMASGVWWKSSEIKYVYSKFTFHDSHKLTLFNDSFRTWISPSTVRLKDVFLFHGNISRIRPCLSRTRQVSPLLSAQHTLQRDLHPAGGIDAVLGENFTADWRGDGNVWESWRRTCPPKTKARKLFSSIKTTEQNPRAVNHLGSVMGGSSFSSREDLTFAENVDDRYNFCENPAMHYSQGHFFSDWRTISVLYPVFSPAKALGYADIRIPSHYYHQATPQYTYGWDTTNLKGKANDDMEIEWEDKHDAVFWRGATTGGGNSPSGFASQYQRHRYRTLPYSSDIFRLLPSRKVCAHDQRENGQEPDCYFPFSSFLSIYFC